MDDIKNWYSPGEIVFSVSQVIWLLTIYELGILREWPKDPFGVRSEQLVPHAYFENPTAVWMEFMPRLVAAGRDGEMAIDFYCYQKNESRISQIYNCHFSEVSIRIERAIKYMSGKNRRRRSYHDFVTHPKHSPYFVAKVRNPKKYYRGNLIQRR